MTSYGKKSSKTIWRDWRPRSESSFVLLEATVARRLFFFVGLPTIFRVHLALPCSHYYYAMFVLIFLITVIDVNISEINDPKMFNVGKITF